MIRRGDVYWISPRGARGREQASARPALIIQNDLGNETSGTTIVALMTSHQISRDYAFHTRVSAAETGLPGPSTVLLEQLQTVSVDRLGRRVGSLSPASMREVDRALHHSLGLLD